MDEQKNIFPLSEEKEKGEEKQPEKKYTYNADTVNSIFDEIMSEAGLSNVRRTARPAPEPEKKPEPVPEPEPEAPARPEISVTKIAQEKFDVAAGAAKKGIKKVGRRIKDSDTLNPDTIRDMFFGDKPDAGAVITDADDEQYDDIESDQLLFGKKKHKPADPRGDKMLFRIMYMLAPQQVSDGYMLFYNEFVKKSNIKFTLIMGTLCLVFLIAILMAPQGYISYLLLLIALAMIAFKWINTWSAKREALNAAADVKNDSYKLSFYNSRILIEASEKVDDKIFNYPPVVIRFEDIDLRLLDYDDIYILVFRRDYIYVVPKESMTSRENEVFTTHLKNILGDDFYVFEKRIIGSEEDEEEFPTLRDENEVETTPPEAPAQEAVNEPEAEDEGPKPEEETDAVQDQTEKEEEADEH